MAGLKLPAVIKKDDEKSFSSEREILYKILFDMKSDMNDLKKLVFDLIRKGDIDVTFQESNSRVIKNLFSEAKGADQSTRMKLKLLQPILNHIPQEMIFRILRR